jgi:LysR family glycine cleavage system transcriptional activator
MAGTSRPQAAENRPVAKTRAGLPPLGALLAFRAASHHGSFVGGAQELGVTPSAISHHIQRLEDFLGVKLFARDAGRTVLTSAGSLYAREVEHAFGVLSNATSLVAPRAQHGQLLIASSPSFAAKWLQPRLAGFLEANPEVQLRLSTLGYRDDVEADRFDIAIAYGRPAASRKSVEPLITERVRPLCSPALAAKIRAPQDLAQATLIHSVNALTWPEYLRRIGQDGLQGAKDLWLDQSDMAIDAAVQGAGVVLESRVLAGEELDSGKLVALFDEERHSFDLTTYYLVKSRKQRRTSQVNAFERWLKTAVTGQSARH